MKQKDLLTVVAVIIFSAIVSIVASNYIFAKPSNRQQQVETVGVINSTFTQPNPVYFNSGSIDPTQTLQVKLNNTTQPFSISTGQ
jgi:hypothetical protein